MSWSHIIMAQLFHSFQYIFVLWYRRSPARVNHDLAIKRHSKQWSHPNVEPIPEVHKWRFVSVILDNELSFLLMTFAPVRKLCVNIHIYIYICIFYTSSVIGRIYTYNRSVIQYWSSCTPSHSIGLYFWVVCSSWVECHFLFSLVYQLCLALWR